MLTRDPAGHLIGAAAFDADLGETYGCELITAMPDETAAEALRRMLEEDVEHLPVIDGTARLVGICTRTDILRARRRQLQAEQLQPGWLWLRLDYGSEPASARPVRPTG